MITKILKSKPDKKELKKFAITMFSVLGILGAIFLWQKNDIGFVLIAVGLLLLLLVFLKPISLNPVYKGWMVLAELLGFIMSHIILAIMYYLLISPIGIIRRIIKKDPLQQEIDKEKSTYWINRENKKFVKERYEKMF